MQSSFSKIIKQKRTEAGLSQEMLARRLFVTKPTIARWENGTRLPDTTMIVRIAECLDTDVAVLVNAVSESNDTPNIIIVDDNKAVLTDSISVLEEVLPNTAITGFIRPKEAIEFAKANRIALAFLDIEMGAVNGLDVCNKLLEINPHTNVVYLTAYSDYSLDAWDTGAVGFMLKPITPEAVSKQLKRMKYSFLTGGENT